MPVSGGCVCNTDTQDKGLPVWKAFEVTKARFNYQRIIWLPSSASA